MNIKYNIMMTMNKVYVGNLIPGNKYHVVDMWDLERRRRHFRLEFHGIYVRMYPFGNIIRVVFREHGRERIVNSINEFYLIGPPPMDTYLLTQLKRNVSLPSNATETEKYIDEYVIMINSSGKLQEDTRDYISLF
jgi:hypothetical protein